MSMMIGWCLHRYETDNSIPSQKYWNAVDEERAARLQVWGLPAFALLVLLGQPFGNSRRVDFRAIYQWTEDEKRRLELTHWLGGVQGFGCGQQWGPSQAGAFNSLASGIHTHYRSAVNPFQAEAFHSVGSNTGALYRSTEAPYRIQENALGPFGVTYVSGGIEDEDFEPAFQGSPPQEERSRRAGNGRKRPRDSEEDTEEEIQGLGVFDNCGHRKRSKRIREGSSSTDNSTKKMKKEMKKLKASVKEMLEETREQIREMREDIDSDSEASATSESSLEG
ncbi:hypothetical protein J7337_008144 [Fusarium musae]|uniref:Uncharacterized protein n=1 Tax=Fusarium musae TaxID=1042133 RepID=A0A9P8INB8_9HYPO|nr:hypothetical protein J7337_008144 [Fusarium musae]KAG9499685.1 hypothetical protein J7337_008144 [Fusarium musae]